jgi:hypothetical protein
MSDSEMDENDLQELSQQPRKKAKLNPEADLSPDQTNLLTGPCRK